jgi:hypothetical protein
MALVLVAVVYFSGGMKNASDNWFSGQDLNTWPPVYESGMLLTTWPLGKSDIPYLFEEVGTANRRFHTYTDQYVVGLQT